MRLLNAIKYDLRLQFRHGFYYAYLVISILYIILLHFIPANFQKQAATFVIFTDPSTLGFFFLGGIILLEKGQKTLEGLFITPIKIVEYILSKIISLSVLALISSFIIAICSFGINFNPIPLFIGVILSSAFFILLGFTLVSFTKSVNHYLIYSPLYLICFMFPIVNYLKIFEHSIFYFFPTTASLILIDSAFSGMKLLPVINAILILCIWIIPVYYWAYNWFNKYIVLKSSQKKRLTTDELI